MVGRWSVGGRPTTYRPPFYGAACSRLPSIDVQEKVKKVRDLNIQWMIGDYNKVKCRSLRGKSENRGNNRMEGDGSQKKGKRNERKGSQTGAGGKDGSR